MVHNKIILEDGDIVVIAQKIVSKAEGQIVRLSSLIPSSVAIQLAKQYKKDPRTTELVLRQSKNIVKISTELLLVKLSMVSYAPMRGSIKVTL